MSGGTEAPKVAVVVLSWNGRDDTLACVESLLAQSWPRVETIVVDNGSTDGSADAVAERFPDVPLIRSDTNLGFAEGNNVGLRAALERGADYALLLNNDTIADERLVESLVAEA